MMMMWSNFNRKCLLFSPHTSFLGVQIQNFSLFHNPS